MYCYDKLIVTKIQYGSSCRACSIEQVSSLHLPKKQSRDNSTLASTSIVAEPKTFFSPQC